jgi:hypothetical protein
MPYLVWVGLNPANANGTSCKGYWIHRHGREVVARWGPVDVVGARGGTYRWKSPREQRWRHASEADAKKRIARRLHEARREGYELLPKRRKIEPPERSR